MRGRFRQHQDTFSVWMPDCPGFYIVSEIEQFAIFFPLDAHQPNLTSSGVPVATGV